MPYFKHPPRKTHHWALVLLTGGLILKLYRFFSREHNRQTIKVNIADFVNKEKQESKKFLKKRENFKTYCINSGSIFEDYFIPHEGNGFKPKILHPRSLGVIIVLAMIVKSLAFFYVYFIYPNEAKMSEMISSRLVQLTNEDRVKSGLNSLAVDPVLAKAAQEKANDMLKSNYFAHQSPSGLMPWDFINRDEYSYLFVGENLAMSFTSAESAHNALMQSPGHKKNIMNEKYADIGIAVVSGEINGQLTNIAVEVFGSKLPAAKAQPAPIAEPIPVSNNQIKSADISKSVQPSQNLSKVDPVRTANYVETEVLPPVISKLVQEIPPALSAPEPPIQMHPASSSALNKIVSQPEKESESTPAANSAGLSLEKKLDDSAGSTARADASSSPILLGINSQSFPELEIISPNEDLEKNLSPKIMKFKQKNDLKIGFASRLIKVVRYFMLCLLSFLIVALCLKIFIRVKIQHKPVIFQTVLAIMLIAGLLSFKIQLIEQIASQVFVI